MGSPPTRRCWRSKRATWIPATSSRRSALWSRAPCPRRSSPWTPTAWCAKAGAAYVSPFIGRLDDVGQEGMDVIREARVIFDNYQIATEILAASIRHPRHVVDAAMIGADVVTLPPEVLKKLLLHPLTDRGLEQFLADWNKLAARAKASV